MRSLEPFGCTVLKGTKSHLYLAPHPALRSWIAHYTVTRPVKLEPGEPANWILLPDASGCLIFSFENPVQGQFWGATTQAVTVNRDSPHEACSLFVEFLPGGARWLLGMEQNECANLRAPLCEISRKASGAMTEILETSASLCALTQGLDRWFLSQLAQTGAASQRLPQLLREASAGSVWELSKRTFYSERQLERLFLSSLGISVKAYARLTRINRAAGALQQTKGRLTDVAHELGYCDQSHFIHDFKAVCGVSPAVYRQRMSDFYKEPYKF